MFCPGISLVISVPRVLLLAALTVARWPTVAHTQEREARPPLWVDVRDASSGRPVAAARIEAPGTRLRAATDSAGMAEVAVDSAARLLVVSRLGFRPDTVALTAATWSAGLVSVRLIPVTPVLDPVAVTGTSPVMNGAMLEFESRRKRAAGGATFIGPEEFEKRPLPRLTDFLRRGVQGVTLIDSAGILLPASSRGAILRTNQGPALGRNPISRRATGQSGEMERVHCVFRVAVDGVPKEWGYDMREIDPKEVYGMEVYAGPSTIPAQYQSMGRDGYCGLILIWTRAR